MRTFHFLIVLCISSILHLSAVEEGDERQLLPDISYLVADLKFNDQQGVQICEVQQGRGSRFIGYDFAHEGTGLIVRNLAEALKEYHNRGWFLKNDLCDPLTAGALAAIGWRGFETIEELINDPEFQLVASLNHEKAVSISDFGGILFARHSSLNPFAQFKEKYPNVLIIDEATRSYCGDKLRMTLLFTKAELERFKPSWNLYPKEYSPSLCNQIMEEIASEYVVIKPRRAAKGNGVIICSSSELDETLDYILNGGENLFDDPDPSYRYWAYDQSGSFIVEAYALSNPTPVEHLDNRLFDPTMRVVYLLAHSDDTIHLRFLGSYWKLPEMSLEQTGSLNCLHKSCGKIPYFSVVDPDVDGEVQRQIHDCLHQLYESMLKGEQKLLLENTP
ncbi:putative uncharacterized protein [Waddlia chondrophila 2032/99]|uniref:Uncharacterized protein n=1 Tax=Waddlia chondrophila 2032/99 TaxID=765953 RepID=F8LBE3_9BACT|nr:putative uncharacterized protein [Waddlia chondrophila 2032/99]